MVVLILAVAVAATVASYLVRPSRAKAFDLYFGTTTLNDNTAPVVVDLASGKPTVRLLDAAATVTAQPSANLDVINLNEGALLLNTATGEFNMVDSTGFVVKSTGGGVHLPALAAATGAAGVAAGDSAYILQTAPSRTEVYLVNQSTVVQSAGTAAGAGSSTPRAHASISAAVLGTPGSAVAANNDLWLLTRSGSGGTTAQRLRVPSGSANGAQLDSTNLGTFPKVAALATLPADGPEATSATDVVVASTDGVVLIDPSGRRTRVDVAVPTGADQILPATNDRPDENRASFLFHSPSGWTLVSTTAAGDGSERGVTGLAANTVLSQPALSRGALYTVATSTPPGTLWRITSAGIASPVEGMPTYPQVAGESLTDVSAIAVRGYGSRVIINNRIAYEAVTVFADGSHPPVVIDKRTAVDLNSSGGIEALAANHAPKTPNTHPVQQPPQTAPVATVNDKINCETASQQPHQPLVQLLQRASRSVELSWQYVPLSTQDCTPSTYTVQATALDSNAPKAPGSVRVQGQNGVNLAGLFPDTRYRIVVTAWINGLGTASEPLLVSTSPEGPPAPTGVTTQADSQGDWIITWNSCGGLTDSCVPTGAWRIIPSFCDGLSLSSPPAAATVPGDPTLHAFSYTFAGGAALLGRGVRFEVEGIGSTGLISEPAGDGRCNTSWAHPNPAGVTVTASTPARTSGVATTATSTTTVSVAFSGDENLALGGVGGQIGYVLLSGGTQVDSKGPTSATSVTFSGLRPGQKYQVQVTLYPPGHPEAAVALAPVDVDAAISDWPAIGISVPAPDYPDYRTATLSVDISGISSAESRGETFDLVNSSLSCGNASKTLSRTDFDPSAATLTFTIDRATYNGNCTVSVQLAQDPNSMTSPPVYGASPSASVSAPVQLATPDLNSTAADVTAAWSTASDGSAAVTVNYTGNNALLLGKSTGWSIQLLGNGTDDCGSVTGNPPPTQVPVAGSCIQNGESLSVTVTFTYYGSAQSFTGIGVSGNAPQPLNLSPSEFTASWATDGSENVVLTYVGSQDLSGGTGWTEQVTNGTIASCGSGNFAPSGALAAIAVTDACVLTGQSTPWSVTITYQDVSTGATKSVVVDVTGAVPPPPTTPPPTPAPTSST
jgi:hypothetical protein